MLGDDWSYTTNIAAMTTGLSAAGGDGSDRILTSETDSIAEDLWDARIEGFIDQRQATDMSEIADGVFQALASNAGPIEVNVPLGRSALRWGIDIPLGSKIVAVLDGEPVVERIRQITTTVANTTGGATETTTAVLGSADAALKTPTQKAIAAMLRRLQHLEKN